MSFFDDDIFEDPLENILWFDILEREEKENEIREELDSGAYTKKELYERYESLLDMDFELRTAFEGELDEYAVHEEIQDDIDSGLYTKEEIMAKYDLSELDLEMDFDCTDLESEEEHAEIQSDIDSGLYTKEEIMEMHDLDEQELETNYDCSVLEAEEHAAIQEDIDSGLYTKEEIMEKHDLSELDLEMDYDCSALEYEEQEEIQEDIDSGLYTKKEIMEMYDLTEEELDAYDTDSLDEEEQWRHEEIQEDIDTGDYTEEDILQIYPDLTKEELERDYDLSQLITEEYVDDYSPTDKKVCEDIQTVIDSGFYTMSEILRMYRGLDEDELKSRFDLTKLAPEGENG